MKKQNKTLLRLGIATFAILPFAALVSCGGNGKNINLESQLEKYNNNITLKTHEKAKDVAKKINDEKDNAKKIKILNEYYYLPTLDAGYSLQVGIATTGGLNNNDLVVNITVIKLSDNKAQSKTIIINGFKPNSNLIKINVTQKDQAVSKDDFDTHKQNWEKLELTQINEKINILSKFFNNVTSANLAHFVPEIMVNRFILTAKDGYTFGESNEAVKKTIESKAYLDTVPIKLEITAKSEITEEIFSKAKIELRKSTLSAPDKIIALNWVFQGVSMSNIEWFMVDVKDEEIVLTARGNYYFGDETTNRTLKSGTVIPNELEITANNTVTAIGFQEAKTEYNKVGATPEEKVIALNKLFTGVTITNLAHFDVLVGEKTFTLTPKAGYTFKDGAITLVSVEPTSEQLTKINITVKPEELKIEKYLEIKAEYNKSGATDEEKVTALNKLFTGVTKDNLAHFDVVVGEKTFTLTPKVGYTFGDDLTTQTNLISTNPITLTKLSISKNVKAVWTHEYNKIKIEYNTAKTAVNTQGQVTALNKLFTGVTTTNLAHFSVTTGEKTFTLTTKDGFTFGNSEIVVLKTMESTPSNNLNKLEVIAKNNVWAYEYEQAKTEYNKSGATDEEKVTALNKLFTGVTKDNLAHFVPVVGEKTFTLTPKVGYTFGNPISSPENLVSKDFRLFNELKITERSEKIWTHEYNKIKIEYNTAKTAVNTQGQVTALNKLFTGVTTTNLAHFSVTTGEKTFTLKTLGDYTFGKNNEIKKETINSKSAVDLEKIVGVTTKQVTTTEYLDIKNRYEKVGPFPGTKIQILSELFTGVNTTNFEYFEVKIGSMRFTLEAKSGYTFGNPGESPENLQSLEPTLDEPILQDEIDKFINTTTSKPNEGVVGVIIDLRKITDQTTLKSTLNSYLTTPLPTLSPDFDFEIKEFIMVSANSMTVKFLVTKTSTDKSGFATITVTGFDINQTLGNQFLNISFIDKTLVTNDKIEDFLTLFNSSDLEGKKAQLNSIVPEIDFTKIDKGFEAISLKAEIVNNNLLVSLVIKNNANGNILEQIITIDGWPETPEMQKLNITAKPAVKQSIYNKAKSDWDTLVETSSLSKLVRNQAKIDILNILFDGVTLANINNFEVSTGVSQFTLIAYEYFTFGEPEAQIQKTLESMHPTADSTIIENELKKINDGTSLKQEGIVGAVYLLNKEADPAAQRVLFDTYFKLPTPSSGFTYTIGSITMVDGKMQVIINVSHTTEGNGTKTILIDGFLQLSLEDQLNKYTDFSLTKSGIFVEEYEKSFKGNNLVEKKSKLTDLLTHSGKTIVIDEGFEVSNIRFISSTDTTLTIEISIKNLLTNEIKSKEITFSNFKAPLVVIGIKSKSSDDIRKSIFTKAKADWKSAASSQDKVTALSLIFNKVLIEDIDKFEVTFTETAINEKFVLTAKDGFTFKDEFDIHNLKSIVSDSQSEDKKIDITNIRFSKEEFLQAASELENAANDTQKITALGKIFQGPSTNNINQFTYSIDIANYKVSLEANLGYTFNGKLVLDSSWPTNIWKVIGVTSKDVTINVLSEAYSLYRNSSKTRSIDGQISALQMVFEGVNDSNYNKQFTVSLASATSFTLEAKENYTFSDSESTNTPNIATKPGTIAPNVVLDITPLPAPLTYKEWVQVRDEYNKSGATLEEKADALNKLFTGVTKDNLAHFDVDINGDIFALKAKSGFEFSNGSDSISSLSPTYPIEILVSAQDINISTGLFNEVKVAYNKVDATDEEKVTALNKLFTGVTKDNLAHFEVAVGEKIFTLKAKAGYTFGEKTAEILDTISSKEASSLTAIVVYPNELEISIEDYLKNKKDYDSFTTPAEKVEVLTRMFAGVTTESFDKFIVTFDNDNYNFILTAKDGFTFNGAAGEELTSKIKSKDISVLKLNYSPKADLSLVDFNGAKVVLSSGTSSKEAKLSALQKLFDGISLVNDLEKFEYNLLQETNQYSLTAKKGYTFGENEEPSNMTITSAIPSLIELGITVKPGVTIAQFDAIEAEYNTAKEANNAQGQVDALNKLFTDITTANLVLFEIMPVTNQQFILRAIEGYTFGNKDDERVVNLLSAQVVPNYTKLTIFAKTEKLTTVEFKELKENWNSNVGASSTVKLPLLKKVFDGTDLTTGNLNNFIVKFNTEGTKFILEAKSGYTFGEPTDTLINEISSADLLEMIVLNITAKPAITIKQYKVLKTRWESVVSTDKNEKITILVNLFDGVSLSNIDYFNVVVDETKFELKTTRLYVFNDADGKHTTTLHSKDPILLKVITAVKIDKFISTYDFAQILSEWNDAATDKTKQLAVLEKLFDGLKLNDLENLEAKPSNDKFTLEAKPGYTFGEPNSDVILTLDSALAVPLKKIDITAKPNIWTYDFAQIISQWTSAATDKTKQLEVLEKLFNGLKLDDLDNLTISVLEKEFVLTVKPGYTFGEPNLDVVSKFNSTPAVPLKKINITIKTDITIPDFDKYNSEWIGAGDNKDKQLAVLEKLFDGVNNTNIDHFSLTINNLEKTFLLTAKTGYTFGNPEDNLVETLKSSIPVSATLEHQKAKFEDNVKTKNADLIAIYLARDMNELDSDDKISATRDFYNIPALDSGFKLEIIGNVLVSGERETTLEIKFKISEESSATNFKEFVISIIDFKLDVLTQLAIFERSAFSDVEFTDVISTLKGKPDATPEDKVRVLSYAFVGIDDTNISYFAYDFDEVKKTITLTANDSYSFGLINEPRKITLSSIEAINSSFANEIAKFKSGASLIKSETSADAIKKIKLETTDDAKKAIIKTYFDYGPVGLTSGYSYSYVSSTSLGPTDLKIVFNLSDGTSNQDVNIQITDFKPLPTLEDQFNKFSTLYKTKNQVITAEEAIKQINDATDTDKLLILYGWAELPVMDEGFILSILSIKDVNIGDDIKTHLEITMRISQINASYKDVNFSINDFKAIPTLAQQNALLVDESTKDNSITAIKAFSSINEKSHMDDKLIEIKKYYTMPDFYEGFTFELLSVTLTEDKNSLIINYKLTNRRTGEHIVDEISDLFKITGFIEYKNIQAQQNKFKAAVTKKPEEISFIAYETINKLLSITNSSQTEIKQILEQYYELPDLDFGYDFEIIAVTYSTAGANGSELTVRFKIIESWMENNPSMVDFSIMITGFKIPESYEQQIEKFGDKVFENNLIDKSINEFRQEISLASLDSQLEILKNYIDLPELEYGWKIKYMDNFQENGINNASFKLLIQNSQPNFQSGEIIINVFNFKNWYNDVNVTYEATIAETLEKLSKDKTVAQMLNEVKVVVANKNDGSTLAGTFKLEPFDNKPEMELDFMTGKAIFSKVKLSKDATNYIVIDNLEIQFRGADLIDKNTSLKFNLQGYVLGIDYSNIPTGQTGESWKEKLTIPESLTYTDAENVSTVVTLTNINAGAFSKNNDIQELIIGNSIKIIGGNAFEGMYRLKTVTIGNGVTEIGGNAFLSHQDKAAGITQLTLGASVNSIGSSAFQGNHLSTIDFNESLELIGGNAFNDNKLAGELKIPASVITISAQAFANNEISEIAMTHSTSMKLEEIGISSFQDNKITRITMPNSLKVVGTQAFANNEINTIAFGENLSNLGSKAFENNKITLTTIPNIKATKINTWTGQWFDGNEIYGTTPELVQKLKENGYNSNNIESLGISGITQIIGTQKPRILIGISTREDNITIETYLESKTQFNTSLAPDNNDNKIEALNKLFKDVTKDNYDQFTVEWRDDESKVYLTANSGYAFLKDANQVSQIKSKDITAIVLPIGLRQNGATKAQFIEAKLLYDSGDKAKILAAMILLFSANLTVEDLEKFEIAVFDTTEVKIVAKKGYTFNNGAVELVTHPSN